MIINGLVRFRDRVDDFISEHKSIPLLWAMVNFISLYFNGLSVFWIGVAGLVLPFRHFCFMYLPVCLAGHLALFFYLGNVDVREPTQGVAQIHIEEVKLQEGSFGKSWLYQGTLRHFKPAQEEVYRRLPFKMHLSTKIGSRPMAHCDYQVQGELSKGDFYGYKLKVAKDAEFVPVAHTYSFAEKRYEIKTKYKKWIQKQIPFKNAQSVLIGMTCGDFGDSFLSFTFSRFGLNHLLAISGFHFSLLAVFVALLLRKAPSKMQILSLGVVLTAFYFFVGNGPSLQRAWIVAMLYLWCLFSKRLVTSINILSVAMILILLLNPFMIQHLGFQFSFLVTFSILMYTKPCLELLKRIFKPRSSLDLRIVQAFALGLAVHIAAVPLCLYHFHKFYFSGLILNLVVPLYFSVLLFGFMGFLLLSFVFPWGAKYGLYAVGYLTEKCIEFLYWIPTSVDYCVRVPAFSPFCMQLFILLFFLGGTFVSPKNFLLNYNSNLTPAIEN